MKKYSRYYFWKANNMDGGKEEGVIHAKSSEEAFKNINQKGMCNIQLEKVPAKLFNSQLSYKQLAIFAGSLKLLLQAGISFKEAVKWGMQEKYDIRSRFVFSVIHYELEKGHSFSESLESIYQCFPFLFIVTVKSGEAGDRLPEAVSELELIYKEADIRRQDLIQMLRYPLLVLSLMFIIMTGILVFIVPLFENMYLMSKDLPLMTVVLRKISFFVRTSGIWWGFYLICGFGVLKILPERVKKPWEAAVSNLREKVLKFESYMVFSRSMSVLLTNGVSLQQAIGVAGYHLKGEIKGAIEQLMIKLQQGKNISESMAEGNIFPDEFLKILSVYEPAGDIGKGFEEIYFILKQKHELRFRKTTVFLEPALFVLMGCFVLFLVLGIYLPVFQLGESFL